MEIYTYYYPGFFDDNYRVTGSEWKLIQQAKPRNKVHYQPRIPADGYYEQNNLEQCKAQISLAQKYGIRGFMICYYWDFETSSPVMHEVLEQMMKAMEGTTFEFNIMWVLRLPHRILPIEEGSYGKYHNHPWFKKRIQSYRKDPRFLNEIKRITSHPNYRKDSEGRALLQLYSLSELLDLHGAEVNTLLEDFNGFHLQGVCGRSDEWIADASRIGIHSLTSYVTLVDFNSPKVLLKHATCVAEQSTVWSNIQQQTSIPFYPSVATGWDASPRGAHLQGFKIKKFPWAPVVIDSNPIDFKKNMEMASQWAKNKHVDIHVASWNEWSEGHYLEPDLRHGTAYLEELLCIKKCH